MYDFRSFIFLPSMGTTDQYCYYFKLDNVFLLCDYNIICFNTKLSLALWFLSHLKTGEKQQVKNFLHCSVTKRLKRCDRQLASVQFISKLAVRGLAVHHAGMLPILKEVRVIFYNFVKFLKSYLSTDIFCTLTFKN